MNEKQIKNTQGNIHIPRFTNTAQIIKFINSELNTPVNKLLLGLGLAAAFGLLGYTSYVRHKFEGLGYYSALKEDGRIEFIKKTSKWES